LNYICTNACFLLLALLQKKPDWSKSKDDKKVKEEVEVEAEA